MKIAALVLGLVFLYGSSSVYAASSYDSLPVPKKGGNLNDVIGITPITLNPLLTNDLESQDISGLFYLPLFGTDGETYNFYPALATKVDISKDKKDYTYTLNEKARFTDGSPVTSDDAEYTFARIMDPKVEAAPLRSYFEGVSFQKIDERRFKFHVENPKFNTLENFNALFRPIQKKQFANEADFNKTKENLHPIGTSCYKLKSLSRDQSVVLECDQNWWGKDLPQFRARDNYTTLTFKIIPDAALSYEKFLKGEIDLMRFTSTQFVTQVNGTDKERFGKSPKDGKDLWAGKLPVDGPMGWTGLALNLKNPILSSLNTRKGLAYLIDYQMIIEKAFMGTIEQSVSPFGSNTENTDPSLKNPKNRYHFDAKRAADFFEKDGWKKVDGAPFLEKMIDGKMTPFHLVLKYPSSNPTFSKVVVMLKEIFKKSGVDLEIKPGDVTALYKDIDDKNFEVAVMGWGGGSVYPDAKQIWSSDSIKGGSNVVSYSNPKVDELIKKSNLEFDRKKRAKMMQEIGKIIYDELPYLFLVERHYLLQGLNSRIKSPKWTEKYGSSVAKDLFHE